jgi:sec-independent protein translocase protein TatB
MANGVRDDIRTELGPEVADLDLASLNPRTFVAKHLLGDDDEDESTPSANGSRGTVAREPSETAAPQRTIAPRPPAAPGTPWDDDAT